MTTTETATHAWQDDIGEPLPISVLLGYILRDLPAIGKDSKAPDVMGGFAFRGIEQVKNALNPLLSKYGVFYVPLAEDAVETLRMTGSGKTQYAVRLRVRFRFHGPAGDSIEAAMFGEGADTGDKATQKAATSAEKYVLFQTFCINTEEQAGVDVDRDAAEETVAAIVCGSCQRDGVAQPPQFPDPRQGGDPEPYRLHMIAAHGYVRQADGKVAAPAQPDADHAQAGDDAPVDPPAPETPDPAPSAAPEPAGPADGNTGGNPAITDDDLAYIDDMRGPALVEQLRGLGLPVSGRVPELRERLRERMAGGALPVVEAVDEPAPDPDVKEGGARSGADLFYCPYVDDDGTECDIFPFTTEADYIAHWNEAHEQVDDPAEPAAPAPTGDEVSPEMLQELRDAVANLRSTQARAYGKYRKEKQLPAIPDMTWDQVIAAIDFIESLDA